MLVYDIAENYVTGTSRTSPILRGFFSLELKLDIMI